MTVEQIVYQHVRNVIRVQREGLDWAYFERWCDLHGTRRLLDQTRAEAMSDGPA